MKKSDANRLPIEPHILDRLLSIADKPLENSRKEMYGLCEEFPSHAREIRDIWIVLRGLVIDQQEVVPEHIDHELAKLHTRLHRTRRHRRIVFSIAAACVVLIFAAGAAFFAPPAGKGGEMLHLISHETPTGDSVEVSSGDFRTRINSDIQILNKDGAALVVGQSDEEIEIPSLVEEYVHISVPYGRRSFVELADGTRIWINSGSELVYPQTFDKNHREIAVSGEFYLEVAENKSWPFIVRTGDMEVRVLGTSFNINAYREDNSSTVVLTDGKVEVRAGGRNTLLPGDMLTLSDGVASIQKTNTERYTSWKNGYLLFEGDRLEDVMRKLSKYYNVEFSYDRSFADVGLYGRFILTDSFEQALTNLSLTQPLGFEILDNVVHVNFE